MKILDVAKQYQDHAKRILKRAEGRDLTPAEEAGIEYYEMACARVLMFSEV